MGNGRKICVCSRCSKEKIHFGLGMCSACLRRTKRETRPSFYLNTCYSEMSRRVKTYDPERPNYFGKPICTKSEFVNKFINDETFLSLYKTWQNNGHQRRYAPSIDRIDNDRGYTLDNLQFLIHVENGPKDSRIPVCVDNGIQRWYFESSTDAAAFLKTQRSTLCRYKKLGKVYKGYRIYDV